MASTNINANEATSNGAVAGIFRDDSRAENAIHQLKDAGFSDSEIGVATAGDAKGAGQGHSSFWDKLTNAFGKHEHAESASQFEDSLEYSGMSRDHARYFNNALESGNVLVTVRCDGERAREARRILESAGADVGSRAESVATSDARQFEGERRIQLVGEILRVHKDRVQRGEVRLRKEIVTENQNLEVPVSREELVIERIPGQGRDAAGAEVGSGEEEIRVPLSEERVSIEKKPVVNEEVRVGKRQVQDTKRVSDTVRHEELRTEEEGDVTDERARDLDRKRRSA